MPRPFLGPFSPPRGWFDLACYGVGGSSFDLALQRLCIGSNSIDTQHIMVNMLAVAGTVVTLVAACLAFTGAFGPYYTIDFMGITGKQGFFANSITGASGTTTKETSGLVDCKTDSNGCDTDACNAAVSLCHQSTCCVYG